MRSASIILAMLLFFLMSLVSCESSQTGGGSKKASSAPDAPLYAPASSKARMDNDEGVGHYQQGHWDGEIVKCCVRRSDQAAIS